MFHRLLWTRQGYVIFIIALVSLAATQFTVNSVMRDDQFFMENGWPKLVGMWIAAAISLPVGRSLSRNDRTERMRSGEPKTIFVQYDDEHSFFFIRVRYWWIIFMIFGLILGAT